VGSSRSPKPGPARNGQQDDRRFKRQLEKFRDDLYREARDVLVFKLTDAVAVMQRAERGSLGDQSLAMGIELIREDGGLCCCCARPVSEFAAFVFITTASDDVTTWFRGAVCKTCDGSQEAITQCVMTAWHQWIDPSTRELKIHPSSGQA
jgi:hypothetical protein